MGGVLPTIRKHGMYTTAPTLDKMLDGSDFVIGLFGKLKEERQQKAILAHGKQLAITERDEAIRTKACIGSKKVATTMSTVAAARKRSSVSKTDLVKGRSGNVYALFRG